VPPDVAAVVLAAVDVTVAVAVTLAVVDPPPLPPDPVVSSLLQAETTTIDRTIAPNAQDFMLIPPTTS
jgi:hypothetical protein